MLSLAQANFIDMKAIRYILPLFLMGFLLSCAHNDAPQGHYQTLPVTADGNASEWQLPLRFTNKDYTLSYNVTNDKKNIYVVMITSDDEMQHRILKSGVTIYFDVKGENNKNVSFSFPERRISNSNPVPRNGRPILPDTLNNKHSLVQQADVYNVKGFFELEDGQFSVKDKRSKIQLGLKTSADSGLVYEAAIPLNYVLENGLTAKNLRRNFSIGIVVHEDEISFKKSQNNYVANNNGVVVQPRVSVGAGFGGFGMGGIGIGIGGGMRRQGNYNNQQNNARPTEETEWYQFRFSSKTGE